MGVPIERYTIWTDARKEVVRDLWAAGHSARKIAAQTTAEFGIETITRSAIIGLVFRNKYVQPICKKPPPRPRKKRQSAALEILNPIGDIFVPLVPAEFLGITFMDLQDGQCRFPRGEFAPFLFCGQPVRPNSSYCPSCYRLTVQTRISQAERETRIRKYHRSMGAAA